ncbi:MAG: caspase family protein, partial [Pseudomonadota bacterium]|nr:caspase family protein [Pseudomonadota bacterium]
MALVFLPVAADAAPDKRVALVIGNSAYKHTSELKNPAKDAAGMAQALTRLGFDVIKGIDLDINGMRDVIRDFSRKIEGAEVALFYYAGHALQIDGKNQLAPVNARLSNEGDVDFETLPLNFVLRQMEREKRTNLVFLD